MSINILAKPAVFPSPWTARAFAIVRAMEESGIFTGKDFQQELIFSIKARENAGTNIQGEAAYYDCWVEAMTNLIHSKGFSIEAIADHEKAIRFRFEHSHHEHGSGCPHHEPIPCFVEKS